MASICLSAAAEEDLAEIAAYTIETFGLNQARSYRVGLEECLTRIAAEPTLAGRSAEELAPALRFAAYGAHVLYFRLQEDGSVLIVRVLHERMLPSKHLR